MADCAEAANAEGNALFGARAYAEAVEAYSRAIDHGGDFAGDRLAAYYSNRAAARLRTEHHEFAAHDATLALELRPRWWKPQLRRALALEALGRADDAVADARELLAGAPPATAACEASALLRRAQSAALAVGAEEQRLHNSSHTMRLNFAAPLPASLAVGVWATLAVHAVNEMGLFARAADFSGAVRLRALPLPLPPAQSGDGSLKLEIRAARAHAPRHGGVLRLRRGRAVADVRLRRRGAPPADGRAAATRVVLLAELDDGVGAGCHVTSLGCVSLPMRIELSTGVRDADAGGGGGGDEDGPGAAADGVTLTAEALSALCALDDGSVACYRPVHLHGGAQPLLLAESSRGICARVWDSGLVFARWVTHHRHALRLDGAHAIELGAGVGTSGLAAAVCGARVLLTDVADALPLLDANARANAPLCAHTPRVGELCWGGEAAHVHDAMARAWGSARPDIVLASDVVYDPEGYGPLLATLRVLGGGCDVRLIVAHRSRHPDEAHFWEAAAKHFEVRVLLGAPFLPLGASAGARAFGATDEAAAPAPAPAGSADVRVLELVALHGT